VRKVAIDAQQFIAAGQALAGGVGQHHDRPLRVGGGAGQHGVGQRQRVVDADLDAVGRADHRHFAIFGGGRAGQHRIVDVDAVPTREQGVEQGLQ